MQKRRLTRQVSVGDSRTGIVRIGGDAPVSVQTMTAGYTWDIDACVAEINRLTDVAMKATTVRPGMQIIERVYGMLEVHSPDQAETRAAGEAILAELGRTERDRIKPRILSSQIIRRIDDHHAQLINRVRHGQMIIPGQTLYTLECEPAAYIALATNEAEKAADINVLEVRASGAVGRVYLGGEERDIDVGWRAAVAALEGLDGREG